MKIKSLLPLFFIIGNLVVGRILAQCVNPTIPTISNATVCAGNTTTLTATGTLNSATNWYWYTGSCGQNFIGTGASLVVSPLVPTTYFVRGEGGCVTPAACGSAFVSVNPSPTVTVNSATLCAGQTATLTAMGANSYHWIPATGLSSANGPVVIAGPGTTVTYSVIGTDINGCIDTVTSLVDVFPLPVASINPSNSSGCPPLCVNFTCTTPSITNYYWDFKDGTTSTLASPSHCFMNSDTTHCLYDSISLFVTNVNGCMNSTKTSVIVYPLPYADFTCYPQPIQLGNTATFVNNSRGGYFYLWDFGDGSSAIVFSPMYTYQDTGTYNVQLIITSIYGCKDSVTKPVVVIPANDINELSGHPPQIKLFPNPSGYNINIQLTEGIKPETMRIFSVNGQCVYSGKFQTQLDVSKFRVGTYILIIPLGNGLIKRSFEVGD